MKKLLLIFALFPLLFSACKKDDSLLDSVVPEIALESVVPMTVMEFEDSITFNISYFDADGDLGENDPNVTNLFVTDSRINVTYSYRIQELSPSGSSIPIRGTLSVILPNTAITDGSASESATFQIYIVDRAGHQSNTVSSPAITIIQ